MRTVACLLAALAIAGLVLPELPRYRAEWRLMHANRQLADVLRGDLRGEAALQSAASAERLASAAAASLPGDPRPVLSAAIALILRGEGRAAVALLEPAVARGERPELTLNLGRARGISGDEAGAQAAFLRTAWAGPAAIATLPAALRGPLLEKVNQLESELRAGRLAAPPRLNASDQ